MNNTFLGATYDVLGIGNAIVDVLAQVNDDFLDTHRIPKGKMLLIDEPTGDKLYVEMTDPVTASGGSAGNTIAGIADLGGKAAYIGKVKDDELGTKFRRDIESLGVHFPTTPATGGLSTARCLVLVTPDGERTMNTFLGACTTLEPHDVDEEAVELSKVTYLEGYLFDPPMAKDAFRKAVKLAHQHQRAVSLSLSDPFCVDRHKEDFLELVRGDVDILFANEDEIAALLDVTDFDDAVRKVRELHTMGCLTRGAKGSVIVTADEVIEVPAEKATVVDTTGAGDLYASGFLFGFTQGRDLQTCATMGSAAAAEVISHVGARPEVSLKKLFADKGLL